MGNRVETVTSVADVRGDGLAVRKLGFWMCTALVVGNMIGSGVFLLPAALAAYGPISIAGWMATSIGAIILALIFGRLARLAPKTGGPYAYSHEGFGNFAGFLIAWGYWIALWAGNAAVAVAFAGFLYSAWAIYGAGQETVFYGFLLMMAGVPVYVWINWRRRASNTTTAVFEGEAT